MIKCTHCGHTQFTVVQDGTITFLHEVDLRHYPPELSDGELDEIEAEMMRVFGDIAREQKQRARRERDARRTARSRGSGNAERGNGKGVTDGV